LVLLCLKMEADQISEMFCFFLTNQQMDKVQKKIMLVNVRCALFCIFCTHDDLIMQAFVWWCMVWFKAMWFGSMYMNIR